MGLVNNERRRIRSWSRRLTRSHKIAFGAVVFLFAIYFCTPYDSRIRSFFRFQHDVVEDYWQTHHPSDSWLFRKEQYPIDPDNDVGIIVKTGYGTRNRVPVALQALADEAFNADTLVVQDFPVYDNQRNFTLPGGKHAPVVDIIGWNLARGALKGQEYSDRMRHYKSMGEAIEAEELMLADAIGKNLGWELDAMKFLPSLEYAWRNMPKKKWYLMLDDDTYIIKSSLAMLLGHLNFGKPHFLGNPVGDYKGRFPHGGSSVVISGAAVSQLYDGHPEIVAQGNLESPAAIYGDKLISTTFMKIGIYLDETYRRAFNGESPWMTRMWADRLCLPLVSFHGLGNAEAMETTGHVFKDMKEPVFWGQLGKIYGASDFASYMKEPIRANINYVGRLDENNVAVENIPNVEECQKTCVQHPKGCLAWVYDPGSKSCTLAPWAIVGDAAEGRFSGINGEWAQKLSKGCHAPVFGDS